MTADMDAFTMFSLVGFPEFLDRGPDSVQHTDTTLRMMLRLVFPLNHSLH